MTYYLFNENGVPCGETTDENFACIWAETHEGYYCTDEEEAEEKSIAAFLGFWA